MFQNFHIVFYVT